VAHTVSEGIANSVLCLLHDKRGFVCFLSSTPSLQWPCHVICSCPHGRGDGGPRPSRPAHGAVCAVPDPATVEEQATDSGEHAEANRSSGVRFGSRIRLAKTDCIVLVLSKRRIKRSSFLHIEMGSEVP
jgi:hypothetical protein